jgi:hypothetical protein
MAREVDGTMLYATVAGCLAMTKTTTESRLSELLSKIRWIPGMVENVVIRRVLGSWLEVGFEEAAFLYPYLCLLDAVNFST